LKDQLNNNRKPKNGKSLENFGGSSIQDISISNEKSGLGHDNIAPLNHEQLDAEKAFESVVKTEPISNVATEQHTIPNMDGKQKTVPSTNQIPYIEASAENIKEYNFKLSQKKEKAHNLKHKYHLHITENDLDIYRIIEMLDNDIKWDILNVISDPNVEILPDFHAISHMEDMITRSVVDLVTKKISSDKRKLRILSEKPVLVEIPMSHISDRIRDDLEIMKGMKKRTRKNIRKKVALTSPMEVSKSSKRVPFNSTIQSEMSIEVSGAVQPQKMLEFHINISNDLSNIEMHPKHVRSRKNVADHKSTKKASNDKHWKRRKTSDAGCQKNILRDAVFPQDNEGLSNFLKRSNFTEFANLIKLTGLTSDLQNGGTWTVFAPPDENIDAVRSVGGFNLTTKDLRNLMAYHIVPGFLTLNSLVNGTFYPTLYAGHPIYLQKDMNNQWNVGGGRLLLQSPGAHQLLSHLSPHLTPHLSPHLLPHLPRFLVYPVDTLLYAPHGNLLDTMALAPHLANFTRVLRRHPNITRVLEGDGPFTVFGLTNSALEFVPKGFDLSEDYLLSHISNGMLYSSSFETLPQIPSKTGFSIPTEIENKTGVVLIGQHPASVLDITATNGVLHVIDHLLVSFDDRPSH